MSWRFAGSVIVLASVVTAAGAGAPSGAAVEIGIEDRANANASIASTGSFVGVTWAARTKDGATDIYAATSRDGGGSFRAPVRVNQVAGQATVSGEQPPRIALLSSPAGNPPLVVMWTAKSSSGTRLVSARSTDGGQSFGPASVVPGSDASGNRGWESMAVSPNGDPVTVWLDHREVPARPAGAGSGGTHQHDATTHQSMDGAARAQLSKIFFANLNDASSARAIAPGVCYCCKTSIATGGNGRIVAAWRHVYPGNIRDIAVITSSDGGRTFAPPIRVSDDNWVLDGCPENGPAVALDQGNAVHIVWPSLVQGIGGDEPRLALFYATSKDGRRFTKRQELPTEGVPRHPQIAVGPRGQIAVAWDEQAKGERRIVVAGGTIDASQPVRFSRALMADRAGSYPVVAALPDGALIAWTSGTTERSVLRIVRDGATR
jgi:hypothetical protein